jgi:hypothetical protein
MWWREIGLICLHNIVILSATFAETRSNLFEFAICRLPKTCVDTLVNLVDRNRLDFAMHDYNPGIWLKRPLASVTLP